LRHAAFTKGGLLSTGGQTLTPAFRVRLELQQASWPSTAAQLPPQLNFTRNILHHTNTTQPQYRFPPNHTSKEKPPTSRTHHSKTRQTTHTNPPQWTKPRNSSRCRASSSRTAASSSPGAASVCFPLTSPFAIERVCADMFYLNSRQARVPAHLPSRRHGFLDHGCYWLHCQAE
jgi:hypothetical protein